MFAGYADAYAGYITTFEEYQLQNYEGASTHFGPHTLGAFQTEYKRLAQLLAGTSIDPWNGQVEPTPRDLSGSNWQDNAPPILFDDKPWFKPFGTVQRQPDRTYAPGDTASAVFWGAHPNNDVRIGGTFLRIQQRIDGQWVDIAWDRDSETAFIWERNGLANSLITVEWDIPENLELGGTYRIVQEGTWKNGWTGALRSYTGRSRTFTVE